MTLALEIALIVALIVLNGLLAMSELAVVSARRARLQAMVRLRRKGARRALQLAADPGRFLSAVQIGITLVGILAGAFSGSTLAHRFALWLAGHGWLAPAAADSVAFAVVVGGVTYLSLIIGELVPKQLALKNPEAIAAAVAPAMSALAGIAGPLVLLLDKSSQLVLRLTGGHGVARGAVSEEEIRQLVAEAESAGTVEPAERKMIAAVMKLGDRSVRAVMTPRRELDWIDLDAPREKQLKILRETMHLRLPAAHGSIDEPIGSVGVKDVLNALLDRRLQADDLLASDTAKPDAAEPHGAQPGENGLAALVHPVPAVHESADVLDALALLKRSPSGMAFVVDEFGSLEGVVTASDILESIAGDFALPGEADLPGIVQRNDGSWLIDGKLPRDELGERLGLMLPETDGHHTVAGFLLDRFGRLPAAGDSVDWNGWRFEVMDMDGRRIDKVLAVPPRAEAAAEEDAGWEI
ncbi:MAG TPA: hemolysin family protein [Ferrovibrio sp.]|uniref:hemolysin family protein n=1 Tax=Ferrovibrio sp. TaxID=1917215 RepID=UPI002ED25DFE